MPRDLELAAAAGELAQALYRAEATAYGYDCWAWRQVPSHRRQGYFEAAVRILRLLSPERSTPDRSSLFVFASDLAREDGARLLRFARTGDTR